MDQNILNFIKRHRVSCLTTLLEDGQPHSATVHYSNTENPLEFFFLTNKNSRKAKSLPSKAALVIGFSEEEWITLQLEGEIVSTTGPEREKAIDIFYQKFKNDKSKLTYEDIFLKFVPSWWRYTELKREPPVIITS